jgi:hypothetical protein
MYPAARVYRKEIHD